MSQTSENRALWWLAAFFGFTGVALGAFGAHALHDTLEATGKTAIWDKAVLYHLLHAVALMGCALSKRTYSAGAWILGILLFSGSLYVYAVTLYKPMVFITPVGGLFLLLGWLFLPVKGK